MAPNPDYLKDLTHSLILRERPNGISQKGDRAVRGIMGIVSPLFDTRDLFALRTDRAEAIEAKLAKCSIWHEPSGPCTICHGNY